MRTDITATLAFNSDFAEADADRKPAFVEFKIVLREVSGLLLWLPFLFAFAVLLLLFLELAIATAESVIGDKGIHAVFIKEFVILFI
ncbi:MAG: hypothetical protein NVV73_07820 [Cellvibrionaceae bacterium]|nr:hypothetical protein [Cellvibrionaceae bacterium]